MRSSSASSAFFVFAFFNSTSCAASAGPASPSCYFGFGSARSVASSCAARFNVSPRVNTTKMANDFIIFFIIG